MPLTFTMFHEVILSNKRTHSGNLENFLDLLGAGIEIGMKTVLENISVPGADKIVGLAKNGISAAWSGFKSVLENRKFYAFGYYYEIREREQGLRTIRFASEMAALLCPPALSDLREQHVVRHMPNAYVLGMYSGSKPADALFIGENQGSFLLSSNIIIESGKRRLSEFHIRLRGRNLHMIRRLQYETRGISLSPSEVSPVPGSQDEFSALFSFPSLVVSGCMDGASLQFFAVCLFNPEKICLTVIVPPIEISDIDQIPGAMNASLSMAKVLENSLYRSLMLASMLSSFKGLVSPAHGEYVGKVLSELDALCNLATLQDFLEFDGEVQSCLVNGACDPSVTDEEGRGSVQRTCCVIIDLINDALADESIITKYRESKMHIQYVDKLSDIVEVAGNGRKLVENPPAYITPDAWTPRSNFHMFRPASGFLPSRLFEHLRTTSVTNSADVDEIFDRARVSLAFALTNVCKINPFVHEYEDLNIKGVLTGVGLNIITIPVAAIIGVGCGVNMLLAKRDESTPWKSVFTKGVLKKFRDNWNDAWHMLGRFYTFTAFRFDQYVIMGHMADIKTKNLLGVCARYLSVASADSEWAFVTEVACYDKFLASFGTDGRALLMDVETCRKNFASSPGAKEMFSKIDKLSNRQNKEYVWDAIRSLCHAHRLRRMIQEVYFVAVIGTANLGKSRLVSDLFGVATSHGSKAINRTAQLMSYSCMQGPERTPVNGLYALDFPGKDDTMASMSTSLFRQGLSTVDAMIVVLEGKKAELEAAVDVIREALARKVGMPMLVCFNRADEWANDLGDGTPCDPDTFQQAVDTNIERCKVACTRESDIHPEVLNTFAEFKPTCFNLQIEAQRQCLLESGVWGVQDIHAWLKSKVPSIWSSRMTGPVSTSAWKA